VFTGKVELCDMGYRRRTLPGTGKRWIGNSWSSVLVRVSIGLFFAISGANRLFVAGGTKPVYETLVKANVPSPRQTAYFVAGVEFVCGSLVTVGLLSTPGQRGFVDRHGCRDAD
jgi:uncharacterized membrane protein YphA (DoxX/SURF4 family)